MPNLRCELHHRICNLRYGTHGYGMSAYKGGNDKMQSFSMLSSYRYQRQQAEALLKTNSSIFYISMHFVGMQYDITLGNP